MKFKNEEEVLVEFKEGKFTAEGVYPSIIADAMNELLHGEGSMRFIDHKYKEELKGALEIPSWAIISIRFREKYPNPTPQDVINEYNDLFKESFRLC
jgi:hypothetical protein